MQRFCCCITHKDIHALTGTSAEAEANLKAGCKIVFLVTLFPNFVNDLFLEIDFLTFNFVDLHLKFV